MNISQRTLSAGVVISAAAFVVTGCATPQQDINQPEETSAIESTMTEEQALAIAEETYAEYLAISDQIARNGGEGVERLTSFVSDKQLLTEMQELDLISSRNLRFEGNSRFDSFKIQSFNEDEITGYLCLDLSEAKLINPNGDSVGASVEKTPLLVSFLRDSSGGFVLAGSESWSGQNFC